MSKDIKDPGRKSWEKIFFKCILNTENSKYKDSNVGMTWHAKKKKKNQPSGMKYGCKRVVEEW